jgi:hypothetical protein
LYEIIFHIVFDIYMQSNALIGMDFLNVVEIRIRDICLYIYIVTIINIAEQSSRLAGIEDNFKSQIKRSSIIRNRRSE